MKPGRNVKTAVWVFLILITALLGPAVETGAQVDPTKSASPPVKVDFVKDIQPIFEKSCLACHGVKSQMGGLRLDSKQIALSGKAIIPGKSQESHLYQRVAGLGDQPRMPMGGEALPAEQIALIKAWIDQGAEWPEGVGVAGGEIKKHWAFIPPVRPPLPEVQDKRWASNPIDTFVLARLEKEGLKPSPEADRVTLLRRLSLDLIGLPPTIDEIDAFIKDTSPNAYAKQVERLLNSPHYGERWGRIWLDAARYADSDGYEKDKQRWVWFYRDWVIKALNRDLPYNEFIIEQLAGDQIPNATQDQIVATGFLRNSMINEEGGIDPEQFRMEAMFDRMDAVGKSILGITIQCAQCHNHKYDPLKQEEYYQIFAFLNNSYEANAAVYTPEQQMKRAEIYREIAEVEAGLQHFTPDWQKQMARWEETVSHDQPEWVVIRPSVEADTSGGQKYLPMKDGSFLCLGYAPTKHRVKLMVKTDIQNITGFRLELMNDPNLPLDGPGRSLKGTGALTEFEVEANSEESSEKFTNVKIVGATADVNPPETPLDPIFYDKTDRARVTGPVSFAIDGKEETAWGIDVGPVRRNFPRKAVFQVEKPIANPNGNSLNIYLTEKHGGWNSDDNQSNNLGRFRLSITTAPDPKADPLPQNVREILSIPKEQRSPAQVQALFSYWRTTVPAWEEANAKIESLWHQLPESSSQLVLQARDEPRETHVLTRGDFLKPAKIVTPGVPAFLNPLPPNSPPTRLTFAKWIVDRQAPTTARAMINRLWQGYFGIGIISTSEDLGKQSDVPSHPELLDWLAVEFMDRGWSLKTMHRLIVNSSTYRQSSKVTPELYARDPYNRLLARGPRFRVDGEIVRDIALAASGLLNPKIGGPSVYSPAPDFLFLPPASYGPKNWFEAKGEDRYRRALYTFRYRSVPYPMLQVFDTPNGDMSCVRRTRSNTPLQALTLLNEPLFVETAQALALRTLQDGGASDQNRLTYAFRRCLSRYPTQQESAELLGLLDKERQRLVEGWISPWDIAGISDGHMPALPKGATPVQLAAWMTVSRVLLNLDETITKE